MTVPERRPADRPRTSRLVRWLAKYEIGWLVPMVPLLLFPGRWSVVGVVLIPIQWLCRWVGRGCLTVRTPQDWALWLLAVMAVVTLWATALPGVTYPAVLRLLAGLAVYYSITNWASSRDRIRWTVLALVSVGVALALVAPVTVEWKSGKLFGLPQIYEQMPLLLNDPVHPNVMAGTLALIMPVALALAWPDRPRAGTESATRYYAPKLAMALSWLLMAAVLFLTKSRGAYVAAITALLTICVLQSSWFLLGIPLGALGLAVASWQMGASQLVNMMTTGRDIGSWAGRQEVWSRAIYMIRDFPFTGIGMGTFSQVARAMYPFLLIGSDIDVPHAHNLFLQVGVDLGVPGLVAYVALLMLCLWMAWRVYRHSPALSLSRPLAVGLLGSLAALGVHGLTDAVTWVSKPAIVAWAIFGLSAALYRLVDDEREPQRRAIRRTDHFG